MGVILLPKKFIQFYIKNKFYGSFAPDFNISIIEAYLDSTWYSLNLAKSESEILQDLYTEGPLFQLIKERWNFSLEKTFLDKGFFFYKNGKIYRVVISKVLICGRKVSSLEKGLTFPYHKSSNSYIINYLKFAYLLSYIKAKVQFFEEHSRENSSYSIYKHKRSMARKFFLLWILLFGIIAVIGLVIKLQIIIYLGLGGYTIVSSILLIFYIKFLLGVEDKKIEQIAKLNVFFDGLYKKTGMTSNNPFVSKTRITLQKLALFFDTSIFALKEQTGLTSPNDYYSDSKFAIMSPHALEIDLEHLVFKPLDFILTQNRYTTLEYPRRISFIQDLSDLLLDMKNNPKKNSYKKVQSILKEFFSVDNFFGPNEINEETKNEIDELFDIVYPHISDVFMYWNSEALFNDYESKNTVKFLKRILLAGNLYGISLQKLGMLVMGGSDSIYKQLNKWIDSDLRRSTMERILFNLNNWDIQTFNDLTGLELSNYEMVIRQKAIINEVKKWIYNNDLIAKNLIKKSKAETQSYSYDAYLNILYATTLRDAKERGLSTFDEIKPIIENEALQVKVGAISDFMQSLYSGKINLGPGKYGGYVDYINEKDPIKKTKARERISENLEKIYSTIVGWHTEEFGTRGTKFTFDSNDQVSKRRLYYYQEALNSIYELVKNTYELIPQPLTSGKLAAKDYYLDFPSPTIAGMNLIQAYEKVGSPPLPTELISNGYSLTHWKPKINYAFQKVFQLSKYRGFDPFFRPLQDGDILDRHHFRIFAFRKMSSDVNDFVMTTQSFHKADFEPLFKEMGARKAEAYIDALVATLEEIGSLRDKNGKIKQISEQDLVTALKHNFGAEWRSAFDKILEKNDGDLTDAIEEWNNRGKDIEDNGYSEFLKSSFNSVYTKDLNLVKKITLAKLLELKGLIGSKEDFMQFGKYLPGILKNFVRLTKFI